LAGLEAAANEADRELAFHRIALLNALAVASGGLATVYMGDEIGLLNDPSYLTEPDKAHDGRWLHRPAMDWACLDQQAACRITGDFQDLRKARIASENAGVATVIKTGHPSILGIGCGHDRVYLNFSGARVTIDLDLPGHWFDRLSGHFIEEALTLKPWQTCWLGLVQ
jgi:amylosucrase